MVAPRAQSPSPATVADVAPTPPLGRHPRLEQLLVFARVLFVGFWANLVDFALLAACFRRRHIQAMPSRCIALVLSGVLTFLASRSFVFRARHTSVPKQAARFVVAELVGVGLNLASFRLCAWLAAHTFER